MLEYGKWLAELEDGGLRYIRYGGTEVARGIYAAVRDRDWGTVPPRLSDAAVYEDGEGLSVIFSCEHEQGEIAFAWRGTIRLTESTLRFDFDGTALTGFLRNRIGFCVLHPMAFAGLPVEVGTAEGTVHGHFPAAVSPHQPFKAIGSLACEPCPGLRIRMEFTGDLFEMEDQRNWTDASYKTYCTPLELPFPVRIETGERVRQSVGITVLRDEAVCAGTEDAGESSVEIGKDESGALPDIGLMFAGAEPGAAEAERLRALRPSHLRVAAEPGADGWKERLAVAAAWANRLGCGLEVELLAASDEDARAFAAFAADRELPLLRVVPFRPGGFVTEGGLPAAVRQALRSAGLAVPVGGGSRTNYAEFNRTSWPPGDTDFAMYAVNPQVHAFDDRSVMETLAAQRVTAADAAAKTGRPVYVGPVTLKPRLNPVATSGDGSLTPGQQTDPRLSAPFGAAWTIGSAASLAAAPVSGITYFETHGPVGLLEGDKVRPVYEALKALTEYRGAAVLRTSGDVPGLAVLALRRDDRVRVLLANTAGVPVRTSLGLGMWPGRTVRHAAIAGAPLPDPNGVRDGRLAVELPSYACVAIDLL